MHNKDVILESIKQPMEQYYQTMKDMIGNWQPLVEVSEKILAGEDVTNDRVAPATAFSGGLDEAHHAGDQRFRMGLDKT